MLAIKIAAFTGLDLDFLVVVNAGCQRERTAARCGARLRTRVVHLVQLAAMAQAVSADG
jgi:hypothetical protein